MKIYDIYTAIYSSSHLHLRIGSLHDIDVLDGVDDDLVVFVIELENKDPRDHSFQVLFVLGERRSQLRDNRGYRRRLAKFRKLAGFHRPAMRPKFSIRSRMELFLALVQVVAPFGAGGEPDIDLGGVGEETLDLVFGINLDGLDVQFDFGMEHKRRQGKLERLAHGIVRDMTLYIEKHRMDIAKMSGAYSKNDVWCQ